MDSDTRFLGRERRSDCGEIRKVDPFAPSEITADIARVGERQIPLDPTWHE